MKEYGASNLFSKLTEDILHKLRRYFPSYGQEIFVMAIQRLLQTAALKDMSYLYENSMLTETLPDLNLSKNRLTEIMQSLGEDREGITQFMKQCVEGSEHIVFDTTHLIAASNNMNLNKTGYNSQGSYDPQVNLLYIFSTDKQLPVYYRIFPGNITGMKALELTIRESELTNCTVVGDKGFCSEKN